jgi:hypothetical protein
MVVKFENTLRHLIIKTIGENDDSEYKVSSERMEAWKNKREVERKKHKGILIENRLLYYSDFYDLKTIVNKNWELFKPILSDKKRFEVLFDEIEKIRNTIAHGRDILISQEHLLKGILLDLKNQITIYHNKNQMKDDFFIQIQRVTDSLGNIWENNKVTNNNPVLRVGDVYEIIIEAYDPKNRKIEYALSTLDGFIIESDANRINFTITKELINKRQIFIVSAKTINTDYNNEDSLYFIVIILPE